MDAPHSLATRAKLRPPAGSMTGRDRGAGSIHDLTQVRQVGLVELLTRPRRHPARRRQLPGLEHADRRRGPHPAAGPAKEPATGPARLAAAHEAERQAHAIKRIRVEHGIRHLKNWRALSRHLGPPDHLVTILSAVAGLVSSQERTPRPDQLGRPPQALPAGTAR